MKKSKTLFAVVLCLLFISLFTLGSWQVVHKTASADVEEGYEDYDEGDPSDEDYGIMPLILTQLSLSLDGEDGIITAAVRNDVTIFPSTVYVVVQLYSSLEYYEDYTQMTRVAMNSTLDLDMGKTVSCSASTGGVTKYWMARMRWSENASAWKEKTLGPGKFSGDGELLGLT